MGQPLVRTRDTAVRLGMTESSASHLLRRLSEAGLAWPIRRGLWAIEPDVDPMQLARFVTAPYPSYVSLWSALHAHGMLSQIPRETHVVSLGRPGSVSSSLGTLVVHRVAPEVFGGYETRRDGVFLATASKALFDLAYLSATHGRRFGRLPELDLGRGYRQKDARSWVSRIRSPRIRALALDRLVTFETEAHASTGDPRP
jgi:predicted transcriptional regulator of viral defense system